MGTRNFTSVILEGKQVVCQYGQWDGYPSYTGTKILEFLRDVDIEQFKKALQNTTISLTDWDVASTYTGSTKQTQPIYEKVWQEQMELNKTRKPEDEYFGTYETVQHMWKHGKLTEQEVEDFIVSTRDTGCDILPFLYERSLDKAPLELFAMKEEYTEVQDFATNENYEGFPSCDAQGYYMINLDTNTIKCAFDNYILEYSLDALPKDIEKEMLVFEETTRKLYEYLHDNFDFAGMKKEDVLQTAQSIAVAIGEEIQKEYPNLCQDPGAPTKADDWCPEIISALLKQEIAKQRTLVNSKEQTNIEESGGRASLSEKISAAAAQCKPDFYSGKEKQNKEQYQL